jgi:hypothetical protein
VLTAQHPQQAHMVIASHWGGWVQSEQLVRGPANPLGFLAVVIEEQSLQFVVDKRPFWPIIVAYIQLSACQIINRGKISNTGL